MERTGLDAKRIAIEICLRSPLGNQASAEFEKMMGVPIDMASNEQKKLGLICLAAFKEEWAK